MPGTVREVPVPVMLLLFGVRVRVHVPEEGSPLSATLPVESAHVGWIIAPTTGAVGESGWTLITTLADAGEVHPRALVTIKVYVPGVSPVIVVLVPEPVVVWPPGERVIIQSPDAGRLLSTTPPVGSEQVG